MNKSEPAGNGRVTRFDPARGVAEVRLTGGTVAEMHAAAFLSGRPARLPTVGESVVARVSESDGRVVVVVARPAAAPNSR
jgi:hypothetical protein